MDETERKQYYSKWTSSCSIFESRIIKAWVKKSYTVVELKFCQRFSYLQDSFGIFRTIFWDLWRNLPKGAIIDPEIVKGELIRWLGKEKIDEAIRSGPEEYGEFLKQVQNLLDVLTKEYYSGFIGRMLQKWDNLHQGQKAQKENKRDEEFMLPLLK